MSKRPNFILFMTDQQRADHLGCMGHPVLQTPNIDAIADQGTKWNNFYVACPVCMPNRASFMTCRMPSSHGTRCNGIPLDKRNVTFVELLREAGYKTALIGKSHLQTFSGMPTVHPRPEVREGFHKAKGPEAEAIRHDHATYNAEGPDQDWNTPLPFYGFDHVDLITRHGDKNNGHYRQWLLEKEPNADAMLGAENQLPHDYICPQAVRTALPEELYDTSYIADQAAAWIEQQKDSDQPYFLMVSFDDPHHPFNPPGKYWDMYKPEDMPVPAAFERNDWTPPPHVAGLLKSRDAGTTKMKGMAAIGTYLQEALEARALTCGMIAMIDDAVGKVRAAPGATEAVTIFTTDHGDHLGDHRMLFKGTPAYEEVTRVPFIWSDPDDPVAKTCDDFGQTHDIGTTILERAKIEPAWGMQGQSLLDGGRDRAFIQYEHQALNPVLGDVPRVHTVRQGPWRLSVFHGVDWGELYNLDADPGEFENLWDDPGSAVAKAQMMETLARLEIAHKDRAPYPAGFA